jgi:ribokinase
MSRILNAGSLNVDHVYRVDHIVRPGETLAGRSYDLFPGGKGANQSAALALAGARVTHAGRVGRDGLWLRDGLAEIGVDITGVHVDDTEPTGHALIQVEAHSGENAIVLYPGANHRVTAADVFACLETSRDISILLLQNEITDTPEILQEAHRRRLPVCLNPAPFADEILDWPLDPVQLLVVNRMEAAGLAGMDPTSAPAGLLQALRDRCPAAEVLLTLGEAGARLLGPEVDLRVAAVAPAPVVDTTAAGDTFLGYFLAARVAGMPATDCLRRAAVAAGLCVSRAGARSSIPRLDEVEPLVAE